MDSEIEEIVNTLTLQSMNRDQLPKGWHETEQRLRKLDAELVEIYTDRRMVEKKRPKACYKKMKNHHTKWVHEQHQALKEPLPLEEKKMDCVSPRSCDYKTRLNQIINGQGTKEKGRLDKEQERVVRETFAVSLGDSKKQFLIMLDGGPGTGKTKTTNRLAEAIDVLCMKTAYSGSTGTAATNYKG